MIAIALGLLRKFWPYIAALIAVLLIAWAINWYLGNVREEGRSEGRAEITAQWTAAKLKYEEETNKQIEAARQEERDNQRTIQAERDKANEANKTLEKRVADFERDNGRLRVKRAAVCLGSGSVPGTATSSGGSATPATGSANGAGTGEINLDDVAREVGRLGSDLDAANIRIVELLGIVNVCLRKPVTVR